MIEFFEIKISIIFSKEINKNRPFLSQNILVKLGWFGFLSRKNH